MLHPKNCDLKKKKKKKNRKKKVNYVHSHLGMINARIQKHDFCDLIGTIKANFIFCNTYASYTFSVFTKHHTFKFLNMIIVERSHLNKVKI